jgi:hypothetical protein
MAQRSALWGDYFFINDEPIRSRGTGIDQPHLGCG